MKIIKGIYNSLTFRIILALCLISIIPLAVNLYFNNKILSNHLFELEKNNVNIQLEQAEQHIKLKISNLEVEARDYGIWNDMYESAKYHNIEWINQNVRDWVPKNTDIDLIVVATSQSEILTSYGLDTEEVSQLIDDKIIKNMLTRNYYHDGFSIGGITEINGSLYLIGASPILRTDFFGVSRGAVIYGRKIDESLIKDMKGEIGYDVFFYYTNELHCSLEREEHEKLIKTISENDKSLTTIVVDDKYISETREITDLSGEAIGYFGIVGSRDILTSTMDYMRQYDKTILILTLAIVIVLSVKIQRFLVGPVNQLKIQITDMIESRQLKQISVQGPSEIVSLSKAFNEMVDKIQEHVREKEDLKAITNTDSLTLLYNHKYFYEYLSSEELESSNRLSILFCDIDRFKKINDMYGHAKGDIVLKMVGTIIKETISEDHKAFRYGGEEFVIVLNDCETEKALEIAERIRRNILTSKTLQRSFPSIPINISIGIASYPMHALNFHSLVEKADKAMYYAKYNGRNRCEIFDERLEGLVETSDNQSFREELILDSALALVAAIDAKDIYTGKHSEYVTKYTLLLGEKLNLAEREKYLLRIGALLHDCGKIGVPDHIIHKPNNLTKDEYEIIKEHTILGNNIIRYIIKDPTIISCVRNHHERWDGNGYPDKLEGENIPLCARIVCIADAYHAMTSDRPYRVALTHDQALDELKKGKGHQFDPCLVDIFAQAIIDEEDIQSA